MKIKEEIMRLLKEIWDRPEDVLEFASEKKYLKFVTEDKN